MSDAPKRSLSVLNPNDKVEQLRQQFARERAEGKETGHNAHTLPPQQSLPDVKQLAEEQEPTELLALQQGVEAALRTVFDPEIPVNIVDLGLIYDIAIDRNRAVKIVMTLTAPACPVAQQIVDEVQRKAAGVEGVAGAAVELTFDPAWDKSKMTEAALLELGLL